MSLHFIGIGAQKAGTTWLYTQLKHHPEIYFPNNKEVHFWDVKYAKGVDWYRNLYDATDLKGGDITPAYALLSPKIIKIIHDHFPDIRLLFVLRDPVQRAWSAAKMKVIAKKLDIDKLSDQWFYDEFTSDESFLRGNYQQTIDHWCSFYPLEQLLLLDYNDISSRPEYLLTQVTNHLQIKPFNFAKLTELHSRISSPRNDLPLPEKYKTFLENLYQIRPGYAWVF